MARLLLLNGPNLNLLGTREPEKYGRRRSPRSKSAPGAGRRAGPRAACAPEQRRARADRRIQRARRTASDFVIFNPGAFTHTSVAMRDALLAVQLPVHRSAPVQRRTRARRFRQHSYFADIAVGSIVGPRARRATSSRCARRPRGSAPDPKSLARLRSIDMDIRKIKKLIELLEESGHRRDRDHGGRGIGAHRAQRPCRRARSCRQGPGRRARHPPPRAPPRPRSAPPAPGRAGRSAAAAPTARRRAHGDRADGRHLLRAPAPGASSSSRSATRSRSARCCASSKP